MRYDGTLLTAGERHAIAHALREVAALRQAIERASRAGDKPGVEWCWRAFLRHWDIVESIREGRPPVRARSGTGAPKREDKERRGLDAPGPKRRRGAGNPEKFPRPVNRAGGRPLAKGGGVGGEAPSLPPYEGGRNA